MVRPHAALESAYGRELTAHDAAFSRALPDWQKSGDVANYQWRALDDRTLEIYWEGNDATLQVIIVLGVPCGIVNIRTGAERGAEREGDRLRGGRA